MDRKEFIKFSCTGCLLGAAALVIPSLNGCSTNYPLFKTEVKNNQVALPISSFEKSNILLVRPKGWQYDIAVHKKSNSQYEAILMQCTHMENQLTLSQNGFACSLHGSRFSPDGTVVNGPAEKNLKKYNTHINNHNLIISI